MTAQVEAEEKRVPTPVSAEEFDRIRHAYKIDPVQSKATQARELAQKGLTRGQIAAILNCPYATVYAATKNVPVVDSPHTSPNREGPRMGPGGRPQVFVDGVARSELIRQRFLAGESRGQIATSMGLDYSIVWAATKTLVKKLRAEGRLAPSTRVARAAQGADAESDDEDSELDLDDEDEELDDEDESDSSLVP